MRWLQNNNPEVPGLVYKLAPLDDRMRKLGHVRKLWEGILDIATIQDVLEKNQSKRSPMIWYIKILELESYMRRVIGIIYIPSGLVKSCIGREIPERNFIEY